MTRRLAPLFAAALVALAFTSTASAASTQVIVSLKFPAFHGTLKSNKGACTKNRSVKLFRKKAGPDKLLGTGTSNAKAKWSVPIGNRVPPGSYYAKAPAKGTCKADKSKLLTIY